MVKHILSDNQYKYYFTDDYEGLFGINWKGHKKYFSVPMFLWLVDNHLLANIDLRYYDRWGSAEIYGEVNGLSAFTVEISHEQYDELQKGTANENLKRVIRRCTNADDIWHWEDYMKEHALSGKLPDDFEELERFKAVLEHKIAVAKANKGPNSRRKALPLRTYWIGWAALMLASKTGMQHIPLKVFLDIIASLNLSISGYLAIDKKFFGKLIESNANYERWEKEDQRTIENCGEKIKQIDEKLDAFYKSHNNLASIFKMKLYYFMKNAASIIPKLLEEQKNEYVKQLRAIVKEFHVDIKGVSTYAELNDSFEKATRNITGLFIQYTAPFADQNINADDVLYDSKGTFKLAKC